jgi:hypothetical protein
MSIFKHIDVIIGVAFILAGLYFIVINNEYLTGCILLIFGIAYFSKKQDVSSSGDEFSSDD